MRPKKLVLVSALFFLWPVVQLIVKYASAEWVTEGMDHESL